MSTKVKQSKTKQSYMPQMSYRANVIDLNLAFRQAEDAFKAAACDVVRGSHE